MLKGGENENAANAFERAAKTSTGGKVHQRQAQALNASGKKAEAIAAYERAISAYESDIKAGRGNNDSNQAGLNSSKAALRALKN
jgi:tetratricopeptide (TPR) repeat protein